MNYVKHFNMFGVEAQQIPCITGAGAPTTETEGAVGCFYMDTDNGDVYKCIKVEGDVYTWKKENEGIIEVELETEHGSDGFIPLFTKEGTVATTLDEVHSGVFKLKYPTMYETILLQTKDYVISDRVDCVNQILWVRNFIRVRVGITEIPTDYLAWDTINLKDIAKLKTDKEDISNKSTTIDDTADDTKYPTTKAVKDYVDTSAELNTIVNTAKGSVINITDSANAKLKGLKIFGKTTQAAEPSVENPQPLVNVGDGGSVVTKVYGKNLINGNLWTNLQYPTVQGVTVEYLPDEDCFLLNGTCAATMGIHKITGFNTRINIGDTYTLSSIIVSGSYILPDGEKYVDIYIGHSDEIDGNSNWSNATIGISKQLVASKKCFSGMWFYIAKGTVLNNLKIKIMFSKGTDTTYEPYKEPQTFTLNTPNGLPGVPVTSGGNYTDENGQQWICDEIDLARGKYVQRVEKITLNSATPIGIDTPSETRTYAVAYIAGISPYVVGGTGFGYCNKLVYGNYNNNDKQEQFYPYDNGRNKGFSISLHKDRFNGTYTKAKVLEILGNDNVFIYAMAEPIETDLNLTDEEIAQYKALTTHKPVTNIFNDADAHMKVDYVADTKTYIDNKFANIENAILSLGGNV